MIKLWVAFRTGRGPDDEDGDRKSDENSSEYLGPFELIMNKYAHLSTGLCIPEVLIKPRVPQQKIPPTSHQSRDRRLA